jgi:excisionase family DNA binding protein
MDERFLTEQQVAARTGISLPTLRRWRLENRGPLYRKFGSLVRYPEDHLSDWEQSQPSGGDGTSPRIPPQMERTLGRLRQAG